MEYLLMFSAHIEPPTSEKTPHKHFNLSRQGKLKKYSPPSLPHLVLNRRGIEMKHIIFRRISAAIASVFALAVIGTAQTGPTSPSTTFKTQIGNFGQMDSGFFRGAQPLQSDYQSLKDLGVKTVIDLRNDPTDYERPSVEKLGMKYVNIPMSGWQKPKDSDLQQFLSLVSDPSTGTVFVHCKAGIHRTGVAGAAYRMSRNGWNYDSAYQEMKNYNFSSGLVHGSLKSYIKDYGKRVKAGEKGMPVFTAAAASAGSAVTH
jgi:tyrosine-protein phosphatase SIW14